MCVDAFAEILWDAGSIPAASTIYNYLSNTQIERFYSLCHSSCPPMAGASYHPMGASKFHVSYTTYKDAHKSL